MTIKVAVLGAAGRMGQTICKAVAQAPGLELVAAIDPKAAGTRLSVLLGEDVGELVVSGHIEDLTGKGADVAIDFTSASSALSNLSWCSANHVHVVCGTTGIDAEGMERLSTLFSEQSGTHCVIAPNFAISAVLAMRLAELAAPYFDGVEVIELHHDQKIDAPSGTAIETARKIARARAASGAGPFATDSTEKLVYEGARGGEVEPGVHVHAIRLRGLVAHEEILFGAAGQSLSIRQDSYDRVSFMPGVLLAVEKVGDRPGLTIGLEPLLGI